MKRIENEFGKDSIYKDMINEIKSKILFVSDLHLLKGYLIKLLQHLDKIETARHEITRD